MDAAERAERLRQLRESAAAHIKQERARLNGERVFLEMVESRTVGKAQATYNQAADAFVKINAKELVGLAE